MGLGEEKKGNYNHTLENTSLSPQTRHIYCFIFYKKGAAQGPLFSTVAFFLLLVLFLFLMLAFVQQQREGAAVWEDIYAKEIVGVLNSAKPGDTIVLDVHKATEIAGKQKQELTSIFSFPEQEVCVKLSQGRKTCQKHFTAVRVTDVKMRTGVPKNVLEFKVVEKGVKG